MNGKMCRYHAPFICHVGKPSCHSFQLLLILTTSGPPFIPSDGVCWVSVAATTEMSENRSCNLTTSNNNVQVGTLRPIHCSTERKLKEKKYKGEKCNEKEKHAKTDIYLICEIHLVMFALCIQDGVRGMRGNGLRILFNLCVFFLHNNCYRRGFGGAAS